MWSGRIKGRFPRQKKLRKGRENMIGASELLVLFLLLVVPLWLIALVDILRSDFKGNDKLIWLLVVIFVPFIGPLCYFFIGRKQRLEGKNRGSPPEG
jgi:hypothetical protein